jgi:DNA-directed RNA polymerase specialized sigma24 family protein
MKEDINALIEKAVSAGLRAGALHAQRTTANAYKSTEMRLYAYPVLIKKIADDKESLQEFATNGAHKKSGSITRFSRSGVRLSPEEISQALISDLQATVATDEYEAGKISDALQTIESDPYYSAVYSRYIESRSDDEISAAMHCDVTTVYRNRKRLVRKLAVWLYGAQAL